MTRLTPEDLAEIRADDAMFIAPQYIALHRRKLLAEIDALRAEITAHEGCDLEMFTRYQEFYKRAAHNWLVRETEMEAALTEARAEIEHLKKRADAQDEYLSTFRNASPSLEEEKE